MGSPASSCATPTVQDTANDDDHAANDQLVLLAPLGSDLGNKVHDEEGGNGHDHQQAVAQIGVTQHEGAIIHIEHLAGNDSGGQEEEKQGDADTGDIALEDNKALENVAFALGRLDTLLSGAEGNTQENDTCDTQHNSGQLVALGFAHAGGDKGLNNGRNSNGTDQVADGGSEFAEGTQNSALLAGVSQHIGHGAKRNQGCGIGHTKADVHHGAVNNFRAAGQSHIGEGQYQENPHGDGGKECPRTITAPTAAGSVRNGSHQRVVDGIPHTGNEHDRGNDTGIQTNDHIKIAKQEGLHKEIRELLTGGTQAIA